MIDGIPVIEGVTHAYNLDPSNLRHKHAGIVAGLFHRLVDGLSKPGYALDEDQYLRDWTIEETANLLFVESDTDFACYHVLPLNAFADGLCSFDKALEAKQRWPDRFITYCGVDPLTGEAAIEEMERQVELLDPVGLKLYPNSWLADEPRGWHMDNPEVAFPLFERAQQLGLKVIAVHKSVPLGPVPIDYYRVDDVDRAAIAFPDMNFEVVHGGRAFLEDSAWQIARFPNVYVNIEITSAYIGTRPKAFERALAGLLSIGGANAFDKIIWGTGAMAFHPQPLIETFVRDFSFDPELVDGHGLPQISLGDKKKMLFDNYVRMTGVDFPGRLDAIANDEFVRDADAVPWSTTTSPRRDRPSF